MDKEEIFLRLMMNYDSHYIDKDVVYDAVERGDITPEQYEQIIGIEYKF